jgi:hypothetical protein
MSTLFWDCAVTVNNFAENIYSPSFQRIISKNALWGGGGGVEPGELLRGPKFCLLNQPRVMMSVEQSVECLAGENEVLGENLSQCSPPQILHDLTLARTTAAGD